MTNKLTPPQRPDLNTEKTRFISLTTFEKYQDEKKNWKKWTAIGSAFAIVFAVSLFYLIGKKNSDAVFSDNSQMILKSHPSSPATITANPQTVSRESEPIIRAPSSEQEEAHMEEYVEGEEQFYDVTPEDTEHVMMPAQAVEQP